MAPEKLATAPVVQLDAYALALQAAYIRVPQSARREMAERGLPFREGLHAASHALINVIPLFLLCNATDLGSECDNPYDTRFRPERLLIYDKHPGGIGLARQVRHCSPPPSAWIRTSVRVNSMKCTCSLSAYAPCQCCMLECSSLLWEERHPESDFE